MNGNVSRSGIVAAIVRKDLMAFARDRFYLVVSIMGLVFYVLVFWLLPDSVDETITLGVHGPGIEGLVDLAAEAEGTGLEIVPFDSDDALVAAVDEGTEGVAVGLSFPEDFLATMAAGQTTTVRVVVTAGIPNELRAAMDGFVREIAFVASGDQPPVTVLAQDEVILGVDRAGDQVPLRDKMRPLLAFLVLLVEMFALATLIAAEIQERTVTALLTTPARLSDFLTAKVIVGTLLAFSQAVLLMLAIRSLSRGTALLLVALLLGALLVTAFGLIAGSRGRDFITVVFWSMLFLVPLAIPAFGALFPGSASAWVKVIPTYGVVEAIVGVTSYGEGWSDTLPDLVLTAGWVIAAYAAGLLILKRRVETL